MQGDFAGMGQGQHQQIPATAVPVPLVRFSDINVFIQPPTTEAVFI